MVCIKLCDHSKWIRRGYFACIFHCLHIHGDVHNHNHSPNPRGDGSERVFSFKDIWQRVKDWGNREHDITLSPIELRRVTVPMTQIGNKEFFIDSKSVDADTRTVSKKGNSLHVSHPAGWLARVTKTNEVRTYLCQTKHDTWVIIITGPEA